MLNIDLNKLNFQFTSKPLLIGGKAMEYYGLRPAGNDIDFVVSIEDHARLWQQYPDCHKDLWADFGVCVHEFEIWDSIMLFDYAALSDRAVEEDDMLVISLEKLLLLKALAMREPKYHRDLELITERITRMQYETFYSPKRAAQFGGSRFIGQWRLDPAQSVYEFGQPPASGSYTIEFDGQQIHFTIEWTTADGQDMCVLVDAIPDGLDHPYTGPAADAICYTLVDASTLDSTAKKIVTDANGEKQGQVVATARRVLSDDGSSMRITQSGNTPDGKHFDNVSVYRRA
jgi:hypothetical protein